MSEARSAAVGSGYPSGLLRRATPTDASEIRTMAIQARRSIMSARMTALAAAVFKRGLRRYASGNRILELR